MNRPTGSNADEWCLFLSHWLDNRATFPRGLEFVAVQIAEAIDAKMADWCEAEAGNITHTGTYAPAIIEAWLRNKAAELRDK